MKGSDNPPKSPQEAGLRERLIIIVANVLFQGKSIHQMARIPDEDLVKADEAVYDILSAVSAAVEETTKAKDNAYYERDQLVAALSKRYPAWIGYHKGQGWDDDWRTIIYLKIPITKPTVYGDARNLLGPQFKTEWKQVSWHIHDSEKKYFTHLDPGLEEWDGHTTEEKYERLANIDELRRKKKEIGL